MQCDWLVLNKVIVDSLKHDVKPFSSENSFNEFCLKYQSLFRSGSQGTFDSGLEICG